MSHTSSSSNTADLLLHFHDQQAKHDENHVEVGAVFGACFVYHLKGCDRYSTYVKHLLVDIGHCPANGYITNLDEEQLTLEKELFQEKADNCQLRDDMDDLKEKIQELEAQLSRFQPSNTSVETTRWQNHWSLHIWQALLGWHKNPMSVPNAIRDNPDGYFLEEDIDVAAWLNKIIADNSRPAFMHCMKTIFGSCLTFEMIFSGFSLNLLKPEFQQTRWITDSSTPIMSGDTPRFPPGIFPSGTTPCIKHPLGAIPRGIHPQHIRRLLWPESGRFGWRQWSSGGGYMHM
ncbi:hypothetical protein M422DRAFT_253038 [Sphaerobolus stellatus SS14]|uniref:Uncharacterized protein n=1 Tax=Sphaerobolus stellatus (strain SS14) TaxID=990650 RepID=A0A0C9UL45_SPHS4|nr:hypothetical protein M422DRAFT_253038 [Sphaerobolus stellatus SS14]